MRRQNWGENQRQKAEATLAIVWSCLVPTESFESFDLKMILINIRKFTEFRNSLSYLPGIYVSISSNCWKALERVWQNSEFRKCVLNEFNSLKLVEESKKKKKQLPLISSLRSSSIPHIHLTIISNTNQNLLLRISNKALKGRLKNKAEFKEKNNGREMWETQTKNSEKE